MHTWASHQLTEFLAVVSAFQDPEAATRGAIERAAEGLEAELGAVVRSGRVVASVGFRRGEVPEAELLAVIRGETTMLEVPELGSCTTAVVPLDDDPDGHLLLARTGEDPFGREDVNLLRGMSRVLTLTLRLLRVVNEERTAREASEQQTAENLRLLHSLQDRQRLLDQLSQLQRCISDRTPLADVLQTIVDGAAALVLGNVAVLRLVDPDDPTESVVAAAHGIEEDVLRAIRRTPVDRGVSGRAIAEARLIVVADAAKGGVLPDIVEIGVRAALAVPIHEHGSVVGALFIGRPEAGDAFGAPEQEMLALFAEQASIALAAARTVMSMRQAFSDSLTGLANRALLLDRLEVALVHAERQEQVATVLFLDLDGFKLVNDSLGHLAGDRLLVDVARRLRTCLRHGDTGARLGGDEFAVVLADIGAPGRSERVATRVIEALKEPFLLAGREIFVSASIGIASGLDEPEDLLRNADVAMYRAKREGGGRYRIFEPSMHAAVVERLELEADLRRALERDELTLHFQPIVRLDSAEIVGVEALLRWAHPTRGQLLPHEFIPLAEETGLIVDLDAWVLGEACRLAARWQLKLGPRAPSWVSVNLSARDLLESDLEQNVSRALAASGLAPHGLVLEITESVLVHDAGFALEQLSLLKQLGVRLAIDDFGTGYSSLRYVRRFSADFLKIAKDFVEGVLDDKDAALAQTIVTLGRSLGIETIAEGIERPQELARLQQLGCDFGQGFLFSAPVPARTIEAMMQHETLRTGDVVRRLPTRPRASEERSELKLG